MKRLEKDRPSERGSAGTKAFLVIFALALAAHAGINFVPVAYDGESFKQEMQTAVVNGLATPHGIKPVDSVVARIKKAAHDCDVPDDALMDIKQVNGGVITAHVTYSKPVAMLPFGLYSYNYQFDYTAQPVGFLTKEN